MNFRNAIERDFLGQRDMRMVGERFFETKRPCVQGAVHGFEFRGAPAGFDIDHVGDGENSDLRQFHIEGRPCFRQRARLFRGFRQSMGIGLGGSTLMCACGL